MEQLIQLSSTVDKELNNNINIDLGMFQLLFHLLTMCIEKHLKEWSIPVLGLPISTSVRKSMHMPSLISSYTLRTS